VLDLLFPPRCVLCDELGTGLCRACASRLEGCSVPVPPGLDSLVVLCRYSGAGRELVLSLKRGNRRDALPQLGDALAAGLQIALGATHAVEITWAPTTSSRRRERGFDQAELLARAVGRAGGWPVRATLRRVGGPQHGTTRSQRWTDLSFSCRRPAAPTTIVIDDVVTSGATMAAAARALRSAGARTVFGATVAASLSDHATVPSVDG
jgi:predicted amidophosphoribosyltransferase